MSEFTLILVLQKQTSKTLDDMAKVQIKPEKLSRSGEIFLSIDILLSNNRTTKIHLCFLGNGNTMSLGDACA